MGLNPAADKCPAPLLPACLARPASWTSLLTSFTACSYTLLQVVLRTTLGDLDIELWPKEAPKAVRNFVQVGGRQALRGAFNFSNRRRPACDSHRPSCLFPSPPPSFSAPLCSSSFSLLQLCMEGYYDGTIFHRVIKDFMVQGGWVAGWWVKCCGAGRSTGWRCWTRWVGNWLGAWQLPAAAAAAATVGLQLGLTV